MSVNIAKEVAILGRLTVKDLRARHIEVFGEATRSGNKDCPDDHASIYYDVTP